MKRFPAVVLLIFMLSAVNAQTEIFNIYKNKLSRVKHITEYNRDHWKIEKEYDRNGYITHTTSFYKKEKRDERQYQYTDRDSIFIIKEINLLDKDTVCSAYQLDNTKKIKSIEETTSHLSFYKTVYNDFIYDKNARLESFNEVSFLGDSITLRIHFLFVRDNDKKSTIIKSWKILPTAVDSSYRTYKYNENNELVEYTSAYSHSIKSNIEAMIAGSPFWSQDEPDKQVIIYQNFDRFGNYKKSFYLTENGRMFASRRKISYF